MGRTPMIGPVVREYLEQEHLLSYLEAVLRVYNQHGRRDNKYKARIKILVHELGAEEFTRQVEAEWARIKDGPLTLPEAEFRRIQEMFAPPPYEVPDAADNRFKDSLAGDTAFAAWVETNVHEHSVPGYAITGTVCAVFQSPPISRVSTTM